MVTDAQAEEGYSIDIQGDGYKRLSKRVRNSIIS